MTTSIDDAALDLLAQRLSGRHGHEEAITSGELSSILSENTAANPKTRAAIKQLMRETDMAILSGHAGYFVAEDDRDVAEYLSRLQDRIDGIEERMRLVQENWHEQRESDEDNEADDQPTAETTLSDFSGEAVATDGGIDVEDAA